MASNFLKLFFLCILVCSYNFAIVAAQNTVKVYFGGLRCSANKTTENSTYAKNLKILLSSLSSNANKTLFYNTTILGTNSSDTVYGMFMCRGDLPFSFCDECVAKAVDTLSSDPNCSVAKQAVMWYQDCTVRYSNVSFFSTVDTSNNFIAYNSTDSVSNSTTSFVNFMSKTMNQTAEEAANSSNKFSTKEANLSHSQTLYCLAQCTQDLSPQNCTTCLARAISRLQSCCSAKQGVVIMFPSCNIRYELYPFYVLTRDGSTASVVVASAPTKILLFLVITYAVVFI